MLLTAVILLIVPASVLGGGEGTVWTQRQVQQEVQQLMRDRDTARAELQQLKQRVADLEEGTAYVVQDLEELKTHAPSHPPPDVSTSNQRRMQSVDSEPLEYWKSAEVWLRTLTAAFRCGSQSHTTTMWCNAKEDSFTVKNLRVNESLTVAGRDLNDRDAEIETYVETYVDKRLKEQEPLFCPIEFTNSGPCHLLRPDSEPRFVFHDATIPSNNVFCEPGFAPPNDLTWRCSAAGWAQPTLPLAVPYQCAPDAVPDLSGARENGGSWLGKLSGVVKSGDAVDPQYIGFGFEARNITEQVSCPPSDSNLLGSKPVASVQECEMHCFTLSKQGKDCNYFYFMQNHRDFGKPYCRFFRSCSDSNRQSEGMNTGVVHERRRCKFGSKPRTDLTWICDKNGGAPSPSGNVCDDIKCASVDLSCNPLAVWNAPRKPWAVVAGPTTTAPTPAGTTHKASVQHHEFIRLGSYGCSPGSVPVNIPPRWMCFRNNSVAVPDGPLCRPAEASWIGSAAELLGTLDGGRMFSVGSCGRSAANVMVLKSAGFSATDLKTVGFSLNDLKAAGFSATDLKATGFSLNDLKAAGFSVRIAGKCAGSPLSGTVRLTDRNGNLQVNNNGYLQMNDGKHGWHFVCDDVFDNNYNGATVACRDLGYTTASAMLGGQGVNYQGWYDDVRCSGVECKLSECTMDTRRGRAENCGAEAVKITCS